MLKYLSRAALAAVALAALAATACSSSHTATTTAAPSTAATKGATSGSNQAGGLPKTAHNNTFSWSISKVAIADTVTDKNGQVSTSTQGKFCMVTMTVQNLTGSKQPYDLFSDRVFDSAGKTYNSTGYMLDGTFLPNMTDYGSKQQRTLIELFSVPDGFTASSLLLGIVNSDDSTGIKLTLG